MYKRILIVVDTRAEAQAALYEGLAMARAHDAEAVLLALQARMPIGTPDSIPPLPVAIDDFERAAKADADRALAAAHQAAERAGVMSRGIVGHGEDDAAQVVDVVRRRRADLVVVACEDLNAVLRLITGSLVPALITACPVPLLVCKPPPAEAAPPREPAAAADARSDTGVPQRADDVLVVVEPRAGAQAAVAEGLRAAQARHRNVVFVPTGLEARGGERTVAPDPTALRERALAAAQRAGVSARWDDLGPTPSAPEIAAHAHAAGCGLLVVGTEGRNAVTRLLAGSLAPRLITAAAVPVLVCRDRDPGARGRKAPRRTRPTPPWPPMA